jgi:hypothetical protein
MVRRAILAFALWGCEVPSAPASSDVLVLHGFTVVDPATRTVSRRDVFVADGKVLGAPSPMRRVRVVDGTGRWLVPAFWDLNALPWGNLSAKNYDELSQEMGTVDTLRAELYAGVAHVRAAMPPEWATDDLARIRGLEIPAAELGTAPMLCGGQKETFACLASPRGPRLLRLLDRLASEGANSVRFYYGNRTELTVPVDRDLLEFGIEQAAHRRLRVQVVIDDWKHAEDAVRFGAQAIQGLPGDEVPQSLIDEMNERHVAWAPSLAGALELGRLVGDARAIEDPLLESMVPAEVLDTFRDRRSVWSVWQHGIDFGRAAVPNALANLRRFEAGGVHIVSMTDSGWAPGTFQGYSTHATQDWMERAGLDPWTRLCAVTTWPAELEGRHVGFDPGAPGDFVALDADPLVKAAHLRAITFVVRSGTVVERPTLAPDPSRTHFRR